MQSALQTYMDIKVRYEKNKTPENEKAVVEFIEEANAQMNKEIADFIEGINQYDLQSSGAFFLAYCMAHQAMFNAPFVLEDKQAS
jgi:hypothetical protein